MKVLITGGAGFIGSNLAGYLLQGGEQVRVLDNLSTGYRSNVPDAVEFIEGDICDPNIVATALENINVVVHLAAARSVVGSIDDPVSTDLTNTHGTLLLLKLAAERGIQRVVCASSSSVYGGAADLPTSESAQLHPRSPYAVSKLASEHYCRVFAELYSLDTVALRFFNVYGPNQRPDSTYAAVIPLFINALMSGERPIIHGDGMQSRDFTYVSDVVRAISSATTSPADRCSGQVFNIACGESHSLLELLDILGSIFGVTPKPIHTGGRRGDVRHSYADVSAARDCLQFQSEVSFRQGLELTANWFRDYPS